MKIIHTTTQANILLHTVIAMMDCPEYCDRIELITVSHYGNGREQGYTLRIEDEYGITFCNSRNSDDYIVYLGTSNLNYNILDQDMIDSRTAYAWNEANHAAEFILECLIGGYEKIRGNKCLTKE